MVLCSQNPSMTIVGGCNGVRWQVCCLGRGKMLLMSAVGCFRDVGVEYPV